VGVANVHVIEGRGANLGLLMEEKARGKGVGKATMEVLLRLSNEIKADYVEAGTMKANKPMRALARSFGFKEREEVYEVEGRGVLAEVLLGGIEREKWLGLEMVVEFEGLAP